MTDKMLLFTAFLLVCLYNHASGAPNKVEESCSQQLKEIDRIGRMIALMDKDRRIPKDPESHKKWCRQTSSLPKKIARYSRKCEKLLSAQMLAVLSVGVKKPIKYICREDKQTSMEVFDCMTPEFMDQVNEGEKYMLNSFKYTAVNASSNDVLPLFCCTYVKLFEFLKKELVSPPCKRPDLSPNRFIYNRIRTGLGEMVELICGAYPDVRTCETKAPEMMKILRSEPPADFDFYEESIMKHVLAAVGKML